MRILRRSRASAAAPDWWKYLSALGIVGVTTGVAELLYRLLDTTRLSMVFLAGVLVTAVTLGSGPAYVAGAAAFVVYNFYLVDPRFTVQFATAEDFLVLVVFLAVAMLTGGLAGRVRDEIARAHQRGRTTAALFRASRDLSSIGDEEMLRVRLVRHMADAAKGDAVLWDAGRTWRSSPLADAPEAMLRRLAESPAPTGEPSAPIDGWFSLPLQVEDQRLGVVAWRSAGDEALRAEDGRLTSVLADIGATAIVRARLVASQAEVAALARTEQLRNALLSSISHDLRTPLASILASASSLRDFGGQFDEAVREDLLRTIEEEAERLNRFVANLLNMTRLESGALVIRGEALDAAEMLDRVAQRLLRKQGRAWRCDIASEGLVVRADPVLLEQALANVVENAAAFSPAGAEVRLSAAREDGHVRLRVVDEGPGVPADDLPRIFEKFYRSPGAAAKVQGTGLGLSIARGFIEALGGAIHAENRADGRTGLAVTIDLPEAP